MTVSEEYPELFHYTTVDAFRGIIESKTFWATHYKDLNDSSEFSRFWPKVSKISASCTQQIIIEKAQCDEQYAAWVESEGGIEVVASRKAENHTNLLFESIFGLLGLPNVFICSFCAHKCPSDEAKDGLLSQWRGYGAGGGIAIVLDTCDMEKRMMYEQYNFSHSISHIIDVTYDNDPDLEKKEEFRKAFELLPKLFCALASHEEKAYQEMLIEILQPLVFGFTSVKHHGFHEEREVRIVVAPFPTNPASRFYGHECDSKPIKQIKYRRKGGGEARYIELFGDAPLPIKRVIVGPSQFQKLNEQRIKECIGESKIDIQMSEIPFAG